MADDTTQIGLRVPDDLLADVDRIAGEQTRDRTKQIIHWLKWCVRKYADDKRYAALRRKMVEQDDSNPIIVDDPVSDDG